jgi:hypothetical protein
LEVTDSSGHGSYSRILATLVEGYLLCDAWRARPDSHAYTHHTTHGATKIHPYYLSGDLLARKTVTATIVDAFSYHLAVVLHLSRSTTVIRRGRGTWKLNRDILTSEHVTEALQQQWRRWKQQQNWYPNITLWWMPLCKSAFGRYSRVWRQTAGVTFVASKTSIASAYKISYVAKLVQLHTTRNRMNMLDTAASDNLHGESPTLYQLIIRHKRRANRIVRSVRDTDGTIQTSPAGIASAFVTSFQVKYRDVNVDPDSVQVFANFVRTEQSSSPVHTY